MSSTTPSYKTHDPLGWCGNPSRGAALGRPHVMDAPRDFEGRLFVSRVRIDSGGYDKNGTYFGLGGPLYWIASADGDIDFMRRAGSREEARQLALKEYPKAKIRRSAT